MRAKYIRKGLIGKSFRDPDCIHSSIWTYWGLENSDNKYFNRVKKIYNLPFGHLKSMIFVFILLTVKQPVQISPVIIVLWMARLMVLLCHYPPTNIWLYFFNIKSLEFWPRDNSPPITGQTYNIVALLTEQTMMKLNWYSNPYQV